MVKPDFAQIGSELSTDILGTSYKITVIEESPYDPKNKILRG